MKRTALALALALPLPTWAQFQLHPPDIGEAMRQMDRLAERHRDRGDLPQTLVLPERPGQNIVSWYEFDWHHLDIPSPSGGKGGLRLYYYRRARPIAERALPAIRSAYLRLVDQFHYTPTKQIPYILYSSKREFQTTNVFQVTESVLGVTSPRDLKMSLPYFGDHERFREVSTHEMVHQFTIQKLLDIAGQEEMPFIDNLPLWFIEGIAEYYTKGGIDPETDLYLRDLVWNPDPQRHYEVISFAEDRLRSYIHTYKLGQARCAFIADVYGKEKIQALIENAYTGGAAIGGGSERPFAALIRRVLNDSPEQVDARWRTWLKRRYYPEYMRVRQDLAQMRDYHELPAEPEAFVASDDGSLVFYRGIDRDEARARLYLADLRWPRGALEVVADNQPGVESLHPIDQGILAITAGKVAFSAQDGAGDSLYIVPYRHDPPREGKPPRLALGRRRKLPLVHPEGLRFLEIADPTFSPDGDRIAFVGLTEMGQRDVYVVSASGGVARQLTHDDYAERDLAWGADGIYLASDATDHGLVNLFRLDESTGALTRLTTAAASEGKPRPQPDGSVVYVSDVSGKPDLYLLKDASFRRLTDFATGLGSPAPAPNARGLLASTFYRGRFRLVEVPRVAWLDEAPVAVAAADAPALPIPRQHIPEQTPSYRPLAWRNWHPEGGIVYGAGASNAFAGRAAVLFADMLRDRSLYLDLAVLGSFDYTQALALYTDRTGRTNWTAGAYHFVNQQLDRNDANLTFFQRDFGVLGALRFPLDRFRRFDVELALGGVQRYCLTDYSVQQLAPCRGIVNATPGIHPFGAQDWERTNGGLTATVGPTLRFGYDTTRLDPFTGPLAGSSLVFELGGNWLPGKSAVNGFARLDAAHWISIVGRSNIMFRVAGASSFAPDDNGLAWARAWWVSAPDNLRGFYPLDLPYLIGLNYYVANVELQVPLEQLIRFLFFDYIEGVAALDFGGVFNFWGSKHACLAAGPGGSPLIDVPGCQDMVVIPGAWDSRTLTGVLGVNALLGPLLLRLHFGRPIGIGGQLTPAQAEGTHWVTNFTLRWFFM